MAIALHWWEGQFYCEFRIEPGGGALRMYDQETLVWQQPVASALAAAQRACELKLSLPSTPVRASGSVPQPPTA